ncbi:MAG TPA: sigma-54 dependent transcriptional regulator [Polyangiaceae bacterium]|jgi:DNA-binding NtrC family response regulator|nr:sigma-54 dependent transcriptional regulator [Polyangiaceae bacterium]
MNEDDRLVCIVDDDVSVREAVASLTLSAGLRVETFSSATEYLRSPRTAPPSCLVLDVELPELTGLELQQELRRAGVSVPIIFLTGHGDIPMSVSALKAGALDFFTKPFDPELLLAAIHAGIETGRRGVTAAASPGGRTSRARRIDDGSKQEPRSGGFAEFVGESAALTDVLAQVRTVASTDSTVLIYGETGTGKELVARALHNSGDRKHGPFIKLNCGAIPAGLLESELMGHEKGAFTGAIAQRIGRFERAQDGTLFLDEIGEMAPELQPKLLRLLQEREFERVGGSRTIRSNARVVAATNRDLGAMVKMRTFREDLYYRLNVFPVTLPPLRERRQDIPELAEHFMRQVGARLKKDVYEISASALARLAEYDWPGNIRELENVIERAVILAEGSTLEVPRLSTACLEDKVEQGDDLAAVNKAHILTVLEATGGIVAGPDGAAARLGVKRSTLNYRMKKLGILRGPAQARQFYGAVTDPAAEQ